MMSIPQMPLHLLQALSLHAPLTAILDASAWAVLAGRRDVVLLGQRVLR